ncbi:MAG: hypothetical protein JG781_1368 [Peptococcaceae bacterium]|nr:hypothetical protein [Peptococcaceae bacterium]
MLVLGLIISFSLILYLIKRKVPMGLAIISGGIALALFSRIPVKEIVIIMGKALAERQTIELVVSVFLISLLSTMMQGYGVMDKMVEYLEKMFSNTKTLLFIIPSLLSTFMVTGSAIVAAPVIDTMGDKVGISKARKAAINLYLRHAWYFIMPISVGIVNASYIAGIPIKSLILAQFPVALACLVAAYLVYIAPLPRTEHEFTTDEGKGNIFLKVLRYTSPLLVSLVLAIWLPFYLAILLGCVLTYLVRAETADFKVLLIKSKNLPLFYAAAGIMIFKGIIENIPGLTTLIQDIINEGLPFWLILIILPFTVGYILANTSAIVGMLYPLLLPLVTQEQLVPTAMLIYTVGYCGYFISPIHLCQALTNEFFKVTTRELYKEYRVTVPIMFVASVITYLFIR